MQKTYKTAKKKPVEEEQAPYVPIKPNQTPTLGGFYKWMKEKYGFIPNPLLNKDKYSDFYREYLVSL